jgi:hypothetical protein
MCQFHWTSALDVGGKSSCANLPFVNASRLAQKKTPLRLQDVPFLRKGAIESTYIDEGESNIVEND